MKFTDKQAAYVALMSWFKPVLVRPFVMPRRQQPRPPINTAQEQARRLRQQKAKA